MSEVLSQSQIDALLSSMRSGDNVEQAEDKQPEKKYRKYDFTTPRKFTKDRIKMLNGILKTTRVLSARVLTLSCALPARSRWRVLRNRSSTSSTML